MQRRRGQDATCRHRPAIRARFPMSLPPLDTDVSGTWQPVHLRTNWRPTHVARPCAGRRAAVSGWPSGTSAPVSRALEDLRARLTPDDPARVVVDERLVRRLGKALNQREGSPGIGPHRHAQWPGVHRDAMRQRERSSCGRPGRPRARRIVPPKPSRNNFLTRGRVCREPLVLRHPDTPHVVVTRVAKTACSVNSPLSSIKTIKSENIWVPRKITRWRTEVA